MKSSFSMIGGERSGVTHFHSYGRPDMSHTKFPLYAAITPECTVYLETRPDWYVMGTAGFEPTTSTVRVQREGQMSNLRGGTTALWI
jgi:hypothetical protein